MAPTSSARDCFSIYYIQGETHLWPFSALTQCPRLRVRVARSAARPPLPSGPFQWLHLVPFSHRLDRLLDPFSVCLVVRLHRLLSLSTRTIGDFFCLLLVPFPPVAAVSQLSQFSATQCARNEALWLLCVRLCLGCWAPISFASLPSTDTSLIHSSRHVCVCHLASPSSQHNSPLDLLQSSIKQLLSSFACTLSLILPARPWHTVEQLKHTHFYVIN